MATLWPLAADHLLGMLVVMLPFAFLAALVEWQQQIRIGASLLVIGFGIFLLVNPRHPRALARIPPTQLGLWSFTVAIAHGEWRTAIVSSCLGSGMRAARAGNKIATAPVGASSHFIPWDRKTCRLS